MLDIPQWILKTLNEEKLLCHKCKNTMGEKNIRACGVRNSFKNKQKEVLFLEVFCKKCEELTIYEIDDMGLIEFSFEIIEEMERQAEEEQSNDQMEKKMTEEEEEYDLFEGVSENNSRRKNKVNNSNKPNKKRKSKITNKEIKDIITFLNNGGKKRYHDDFLIELGLSPEEIDSYKIKKK